MLLHKILQIHLEGCLWHLSNLLCQMKWVTILIVDVIVVQASEDLFGNRSVFDFMFFNDSCIFICCCKNLKRSYWFEGVLTCTVSNGRIIRFILLYDCCCYFFPFAIATTTNSFLLLFFSLASFFIHSHFALNSLSFHYSFALALLSLHSYFTITSFSLHSSFTLAAL